MRWWRRWGIYWAKYSKLNPILTAADWPYPVNSVFNAGAALLADAPSAQTT